MSRRMSGREHTARVLDAWVWEAQWCGITFSWFRLSVLARSFVWPRTAPPCSRTSLVPPLDMDVQGDKIKGS